DPPVRGAGRIGRGRKAGSGLVHQPRHGGTGGARDARPLGAARRARGMLPSPHMDLSVGDEAAVGPRVVVSVHDVSPATAHETARWCADADSFGIPVSLLVIPGPWRGRQLLDEPGYADVLRARVARGDELVLHGWSQQAGPEGGRVRRAVGRAVARGAAEFAALDEDQAARRLAQARAVLDELGLTAHGFTPPGWLASAAAERALVRAGFRYTT